MTKMATNLWIHELDEEEMDEDQPATKATYTEEYVNSLKNEIVKLQNLIGERVSGGFLQLFLGDYTITNDKNDYVESSEIKHWVEKKKLGISMKKFGMEMKKYLLVKKFEKVENKLKKNRWQTESGMVWNKI